MTGNFRTLQPLSVRSGLNLTKKIKTKPSTLRNLWRAFENLESRGSRRVSKRMAQKDKYWNSWVKAKKTPTFTIKEREDGIIEVIVKNTGQRACYVSPPQVPRDPRSASPGETSRPSGDSDKELVGREEEEDEETEIEGENDEEVNSRNDQPPEANQLEDEAEDGFHEAVAQKGPPSSPLQSTATSRWLLEPNIPSNELEEALDEVSVESSRLSMPWSAYPCPPKMFRRKTTSDSQSEEDSFRCVERVRTEKQFKVHYSERVSGSGSGSGSEPQVSLTINIKDLQPVWGPVPGLDASEQDPVGVESPANHKEGVVVDSDLLYEDVVAREDSGAEYGSGKSSEDDHQQQVHSSGSKVEVTLDVSGNNGQNQLNDAAGSDESTRSSFEIQQNYNTSRESFANMSILSHHKNRFQHYINAEQMIPLFSALERPHGVSPRMEMNPSRQQGSSYNEDQGQQAAKRSGDSAGSSLEVPFRSGISKGRKSGSRRNFVCSFPGCSSSFINMHALNSHIDRFHALAATEKRTQKTLNQLPPNTVYEEGKEKPFVCRTSDCKWTFKELFSLKRHHKNIHVKKSKQRSVDDSVGPQSSEDSQKTVEYY